tara:strand:- start:315 stop:602 length:288 start_codon:yes stop_codon:yes gene_type:complete
MLLIVPIFGINFIFHLIGNIFLIVILVPVLFIIIALLAFNSFKSKSQVCANCGLTLIGSYDNCIYCGSSFSTYENENDSTKASESIIEIEAEEIK